MNERLRNIIFRTLEKNNSIINLNKDWVNGDKFIFLKQSIELTVNIIWC